MRLCALLVLVAAFGVDPIPRPIAAPSLDGYPIGLPGRPRGDGFFIRHAYVAENTWYLPGHWHTGEDWYALRGDTAGANVYAIGAGKVAYAAANYPGRVVIVEHARDLFSMYGHLDPALAVKVGQRVAAGDLLGKVLRRDDKTPNHLHFEIRTFLLTTAVNGARPRYGFRCGVRCPPGPGYWPSRAPEHPGALGWRNPTHVINHAVFTPGGTPAAGEVVVVTQPAEPNAMIWSAPPGTGDRRMLGRRRLAPGDRYVVVEARIGPRDSRGTSAEAYDIWYRVRIPDGPTGWVRAAISSSLETGSDRRASSVRFNFVPSH